MVKGDHPRVIVFFCSWFMTLSSRSLTILTASRTTPLHG